MEEPVLSKPCACRHLGVQHPAGTRECHWILICLTASGTHLIKSHPEATLYTLLSTVSLPRAEALVTPFLPTEGKNPELD